MEIALGELALSPQEFYEYTMEEFVIKVEGARKVMERDTIDSWRQTRKICWYMVAAMHGSKKAGREENILPLPGDVRRKSKVAVMSEEERQEWTKAVREDMINKGFITDN